MPSERPTRDASRTVRRIGLVVAVVMLFVVAMIAAGIQGEPTFRPSDPAPQESSLPLPTVDPGGTGLPEPLEVDETSAAVAQTLAIVLMVLVAAGLLTVLALVIRALLRAWRARPLRRKDAADVAGEIDTAAAAPEPDVAVGVIRRGIAGALHAIEQRPQASDAIVAAWLGLEESAADAGVARSPSETPGEFAVRIITRRPGATDETAALLRLYESVRFGTRIADDRDRAAALAALRRIEQVWR